MAACEYELTEEENTALCTCLTTLCSSTLNSNIFPTVEEESSRDEALEDSISQPLFVLMRCLCDAPEEDPTRQTLIGVLAEMSDRSPRLPYLLLHFINVRLVTGRGDGGAGGGGGRGDDRDLVAGGFVMWWRQVTCSFGCCEHACFLSDLVQPRTTEIP